MSVVATVAHLSYC